ncbi:MAG: hypothetical protein CL666_05380 [Balneola sp.]|nr:hypothetical protein [Balneola sp.]|tara:strand:+ start:75554 stop:75943 length:390 start_codon:yes stop_codon:yes gene_type:complete
MKRTPLILLLLLATAVLLSNCTQSGPCEGSLILENPIPDTTVAVGDTLFIDLTNPPVFVSSEGRISYHFNGIQGATNIRLNLVDNPNDDDKNTLFLIYGLNQGESILELKASSSCLENSQLLKITITES